MSTGPAPHVLGPGFQYWVAPPLSRNSQTRTACAWLLSPPTLSAMPLVASEAVPWMPNVVRSPYVAPLNDGAGLEATLPIVVMIDVGRAWSSLYSVGATAELATLPARSVAVSTSVATAVSTVTVLVAAV